MPTSTQVSTSTLTNTKLAVATAFLGAAAVFAAVAGAPADQCIVPSETAFDGEIYVCEKTAITLGANGAHFTVGKYTPKAIRLYFDNPDAFLFADTLGEESVAAPSVFVVKQNGFFSVKAQDEEKSVLIKYLGQHKQYGVLMVKTFDEDAPSTLPALCDDSDGGYKIYEKGTVEGVPPETTSPTMKMVEDHCDQGKTGTVLYEGLCLDSGEWYFATTTCQFGCFDGACVASSTDAMASTTVACDDSDGGLNFTEKGTVTGPGGSESDYCFNSLKPKGPLLAEQYCMSDGVSTSTYSFDCAEIGMECNNGACVPSSTISNL